MLMSFSMKPFQRAITFVKIKFVNFDQIQVTKSEEECSYTAKKIATITLKLKTLLWILQFFQLFYERRSSFHFDSDLF